MKKILSLCIVIAMLLPIGSIQDTATASVADDSHCLEYLMGLPTNFYFDMNDFDNPFNCFFSNGSCFVCTQFDRSMYEE